MWYYCFNDLLAMLCNWNRQANRNIIVVLYNLLKRLNFLWYFLIFQRIDISCCFWATKCTFWLIVIGLNKRAYKNEKSNKIYINVIWLHNKWVQYSIGQSRFNSGNARFLIVIIHWVSVNNFHKSNAANQLMCYAITTSMMLARW